MRSLIKEMVQIGTRKRPSGYLAHLKKNTTKEQHKLIAKAMAEEYAKLTANKR